jgi:hypothetical protein
MPLLIVLLALGCSWERTSCQRYESALSYCLDELAAGQDTDTGWETAYAVDIDASCPDADAIDERTDAIYLCLYEAWSGADCTSSDGVLEAAVVAGDCGVTDAREQSR